MIVAGQERLQGWKEIAAYLRRDERTVKRWEKQRGLPVRRIPGGGRANVYCIASELESWFDADRARAALPEPESSGDQGPQDEAAAMPPGLSPVESATGPAAEAALDEASGAAASPRWRTPAALATTVAAGIAVAVAVTAALYLPGRAMSRTPLLSTATRVAAGSVGSIAHDRYLEGVYLLEERTPSSLMKARRAFEDGIASDPKYAADYAGLANTFLLLREYSTMPSDEAYRRAQEAAERAVMLDAGMADAHTALGFIAFFHAWNADAAEREFQTALRLDPNSALAHHWYGSMLMHEARFSEALTQLDEAQDLQPTSPAILATKAYALGLSGHRNEATDMLQMLDAKEKNDASLHRTLAQLSLVEPRDPARYLDEFRKFAAVCKDQEQLAMFAVAEAGYRRGGEEGMWSDLLEHERRAHNSPGHPTYYMAEFEAALGQEDAAIRDLRLLAIEHEPQAIGVKIDPLFTTLRQRPEFDRVLEPMRSSLGRQTMQAHAQLRLER